MFLFLDENHYRCKDAKIVQFVILVFLRENNHKIDLNIEIFEIFYSLMISTRMLFDFSIIILYFMFLICI
jgi:hypothetical protein